MTKRKTKKWCGHRICHFPCDNENHPEEIEKRRTVCPCRLCKANRRVMDLAAEREGLQKLRGRL